ncbi:rRNA methyltransferase 2, mitochondrial [Strongylocentrotus purpuratus]|uniref:rRNA methyltransferase 2, mitochondrial n=1 Tax=Strongylocentrotus purpuratus TaxID=7668 RepID=A0A7M7RC00_STRPU|nr:rRNA methyltransferase 2, mitochondrial [Strongylocentrotus purpuratus]
MSQSRNFIFPMCTCVPAFVSSQSTQSMFSPTRSLHLSGVLRKKKPGLKNKSHSSQQWINRHVNDPFVKQARADSYRARSAYKLLEIDSRYRLLKPGNTVIDCGAAPGSWTQMAVERTNSALQNPAKPRGIVIAVDLLHMQPIEGAIMLGQSDFTDPAVQERILGHLDKRLSDAVLSDMAPNATGIHAMDHEQIIALARTAMGFATKVLCENGHFLVKLWDGHDTGLLKRDLVESFRSVKILRPEASRKESSEIFLLAQGFKRYLVHPKS